MLRKLYNEDADSIVFVDEDYIIIAKDGGIKGTLFAPLDIVNIGIDGIVESLEHLQNKEDKIKIIDSIISSLENIKNDSIKT